MGGNVTLTSRVTILRGAVDGTNGNHNFTIMDSAGSNLHNDINLGSGTFTLANTGSGQVNFSIVGSVGAPLTIEAGNINFMRSNSVVWVLQAGVVAQGADLTLRATGDITFQGTVINLGPGRLEMSADNEGNGTGTIIAANTPQILVGSLVLRHAAAFPADFMADDSAITGAVDLRITGAMVTQAIHPWMELDGTSFTLRGDEGEGARAAVVLTAITIGEDTLNYGTTDIDLQADAITLSADVVLTGGAISLTGALTTATNNLTITASGLLTLNDDITLGTGILTITADDRINVPTSGTRIRAMANNIIFTDRLVQSFEVGFTPAGSTTSTFNNMIFIPTATSTFAPSPCLADLCILGGDGSANVVLDPLLEARISITINAGTNALTFGGEGAITITSPIISITAGSIDIGTRSLTIMAAGGTITLVGVTSITGTGTASLSLDATTIAGLSSALTVDVPSISLAQNTAFGDTAPFTIPAMGISSLALTTAADQTVQGWMVATGRSLSLTSTGGRITATADINTGSGDIILNGARGLTLGNTTSPSTITLTGGDVSLTGAISNNIGFTVAASGVLTLNNNIALTSGATLNLTGTGGIILGNNITISGAGRTTFSGAIDESAASPDASGRGGNDSLSITATSTLTIGGNINLGTGNLTLIAGAGASGNLDNNTSRRTFTAASVRLSQDLGFGTADWTIVSPILSLTTGAEQPVAAWMLPSAGTRALSITSGGDITVGSGMDLSRVDLTLQAATITLGGDLTATSIALRTNTITRPNANLTITATVGGITGTAFTAGGALPAFDSTVTTLTLIQNSPFGSSAPFTFGTTLTVMLETAASQTTQGWMAAIGRDLNLTSTGGDITIGGNINVGTADLNLTASGNIMAVTPRPLLTAATVNLELTGTNPFTSRFFDRTSRITTLTITTAADQQYRGWMAPDAGTNRNLTIVSQGAITINSTAINLGTGNLTLLGANTIITDAAGLTITAGDFQFTGGTIGHPNGVTVSQFVVIASGDIILDSTIGLPTARVELRADTGSIMPAADRAGLGISPPLIMANSLFMRQMGAFADDVANLASLVPGAVNLRVTGMGVDQTIHPWMTNLGDGNFQLRGVGGAGGVALNSITTTAALTRTGRIDLRATAINLGAALTGGEVRLRTNTITGDSANLVAIHAMTGDITTTRINTSTGAEATGLPTLAAGVRAFSLTRTSTFEGRDSVPFAFVNSVITAITLSTRSEQIVRGWMIARDRNLAITSSGRVIVDAAIGPLEGSRNIGAGNLSLTSTGEGIVRILANISTTGNITLSSGTGGINFNGRAAKTLSGGTITLSGNARSDRRLTINATTGALTLSGGINLTGTRVLSLSSMSDEITLGGALTLTGGSIMFGNAVITGAANLTITTDTLTLNNNITLTGTSILDLESRQGAITGMGTLTLSATTTVRLRQADVFSSAPPFDLSGIGSLELVTTATVNQDVLNWMIEPNRNLTVTSARNVFVRSAIGAGLDARDLGTGSLTLISERRVRILADITTTGNIILTGVASETQPAIRFENGTRVVMGGSVRLNGSAGVLTSGSSVTLNATATNGILTLNGNVNTRFTAADGTNTFGDLTLTGATIQIGLTFGTPANTRILLRGQNIMLTSPTLSPPSTSGILLGRFTRGGDFRPNNDVANLTVNAQGTSTIAADITVADGTRSGGDIALTGGSIAFGDAARTIIGRAIRLRGAATGAADLTLTARGTLTIENDIGIGANTLTLTSGVGAISNGGATGDNRPTLTAGTVSLSQVDEFAATRLFTFAAAIGSLEFETTVNQDVLSWMIFENTNLTVESSARVRVTAAIGSGGRNLGTGNLSLTSTGGTVRIMADITTTGSITLIGGTGGINFNGGTRKTLSGGNVTLSGNARSDRRLTINATSGVLTLSGAINTSTSALSLSGSGGITLGGALTLTGGSITLSNEVTGAANLTINVSSTLTLTRNITLTGTSILDLRSGGQGALTGTVMLTAPTVRLSQVVVFGGTQPPFTISTDSLELTTTVNQDVHDWMIAPGINLTVTSARNVFVRSAIGAGLDARDLGTGSLTLISERRVRILADIATTGNIILTGVASETQPAIRFENGARMVMGGNIRLNGPAGIFISTTDTGRNGGAITLNANATSGILTLTGDVIARDNITDPTTPTFSNLTLTGATIQIGLTFGTPANTRILLRGQNITLTSPTLSPPSTSGILLGRFTRGGDFRPNNDVANLTVNAQGTSTIAADITVADDARSGGDIEIRGRREDAMAMITPIAFTDARTITGRAIRLRGAATGAADLTITASGTLTIENDINIGANTLTLTSGAGAISNGGAAPDARPTLTASTVSLAQVDAFAATRLFTFAAAIDSLVLITTVNQDVLSWMIFENTNLTVTSSARVRVTAAIGSGGRNLGDGDLTLTSTGGTVRIMADITTMGDLTLNDFTGLEGVTGDINFNGGARILNGAAITLTGAARSDRALTIDAMGMLTINNNINIGTGALTLTGASLTFGSSVALTAGSHSFTPNRTCNTGTSPSCNR